MKTNFRRNLSIATFATLAVLATACDTPAPAAPRPNPAPAPVPAPQPYVAPPTAPPPTAAPTTTPAPSGFTLPSTDRSKFNITIDPLTSLDAKQQAAVTAAVAKWQSAVTADIPDVSVNLPANDCGANEPAMSGTIDDVVIHVAFKYIDGAGSVLGYGGPCRVGSDGLPRTGSITLDSADVANMPQSALTDTITHEFGHVLGIGTVWQSKGLLTASKANFTGTQANAVWNGRGGVGQVPVETTGGPGTAFAHWDKTTFGTELMTGWLGNSTYLDQVTIASLGDLGYPGINLNAADPIPNAMARMALRIMGAAPVQEDRELIHTVPQPLP